MELGYKTDEEDKKYQTRGKGGLQGMRFLRDNYNLQSEGHVTDGDS